MVVQFFLDGVHLWECELTVSEDCWDLCVLTVLLLKDVFLKDDIASKDVNDVVLMVDQVPTAINSAPIEIVLIVVHRVLSYILVAAPLDPTHRELSKLEDLGWLIEQQLVAVPNDDSGLVDDVALVV